MANTSVAGSANPQDVDAGHRKVVRIIFGTIMDYKHHSPTDVADCLNKLLQLFKNVIDHPDDPRFRKIRASNKAFEHHVANMNGAIEVMVECGWRTKVVDFERSWVFQYPQGSTEFEVMEAAVHELEKAAVTAEAKSKHFEERLKDPHADERQLRKQLLLQIEADRQERHQRFVYLH